MYNHLSGLSFVLLNLTRFPHREQYDSPVLDHSVLEVVRRLTDFVSPQVDDTSKCDRLVVETLKANDMFIIVALSEIE